MIWLDNRQPTSPVKNPAHLLLARLMGQYCFARWRLSSVVVVCRRRRLSSVTLPAGGRAGRRHVGGRLADTAWRASTVMSR